MAADPDCLFCKIVAGDVPSTLVHEDERTVAFMDINPATRGHLLVIPRKHHADVHVIPRYENDPLRLPWHPQPGDRDEIAAAAKELGAG